MNSDVVAVPMLLVDLFTARSARAANYDYVEELRMGPSEGERYLFGVKALTKAEGTESCIPQLKDALQAVASSETNANAMPPGMQIKKLE